MSLLAQSSVIIVLLAEVVSVDVKPCCGPTKWTSGVIQTVGEYNADQDAASLAYGNTTMYYDYDNKQLAYRQVWDNTTAGTVQHRRIVIKYMPQSKAEKYVIINQTCSKVSIQEDMESPCIPADADFLGPHTFAKQLTVNIWLIKTLDGAKRVAVTEKTCMRTTMSRLIATPGTVDTDYQVELNVYQNSTTGITDPSVFDIPSFCNNMTKLKGPSTIFQSCLDRATTSWGVNVSCSGTPHATLVFQTQESVRPKQCQAGSKDNHYFSDEFEFRQDRMRS